MKLIPRVINKWFFFWPILLIYVVLWSLPASLWFYSSGQFISDAKAGTSPIVIEERTIRISFNGEYSTSTREIETNEIAGNCTGSAQLRYRSGISGVKTSSLVSWTDNNPECAKLLQGTYYTETCRTVLRPFWGIVPAKEECWVSNIFRVF